jgi:hypothetical protein
MAREESLLPPELFHLQREALRLRAVLVVARPAHPRASRRSTKSSRSCPQKISSSMM